MVFLFFVSFACIIAFTVIVLLIGSVYSSIYDPMIIENKILM